MIAVSLLGGAVDTGTRGSWQGVSTVVMSLILGVSAVLLMVRASEYNGPREAAAGLFGFAMLAVAAIGVFVGFGHLDARESDGVVRIALAAVVVGTAFTLAAWFGMAGYSLDRDCVEPPLSEPACGPSDF